MTTTPIRFATIGTGKIVQQFLEAALRVPQLEYAAVYSRKQETAEAFAKTHGAKRYYTSLEDLAKDREIDAVYIASPNCLHHDQAVLMMQQGKHVLCEKPAASNSSELADMLKASADYQVIFMEAMRCVFEPAYAAIQNNLEKLGTIRRVTLQYCQYSSRYDNFKKGIIENAFIPELSNGALMDIGVYCLHTLVKLFGMPDSLEAFPVKLSNGVDGAGTIICSYPDKQADILYSKITESSTPSQIQGEDANMLIYGGLNDIKGIEIVYRGGDKEVISLEKDHNNMLYEIIEWVDLIQNNKSATGHNAFTRMELSLLDEARKKMHIAFPADKN